MTLQQSLEAMAAAAAGVVLNALLALACLHFHLNLETGFWFVMLGVSLASLVDAARERRTLLRGGSILLLPSQSKAFPMAMCVFFDITVVQILFRTTWDIVPQVLHIPVHAVLGWYALLLVMWGVNIGVVTWRVRKKGFCWLQQRDDAEAGPSLRDYDVPPFSISGLRTPATAAFWVAFILMPLFQQEYIKGLVRQFSMRLFFADLALCGALAVAAVLSYMGLVAILTYLNYKRARLWYRAAPLADETVWPPPPTPVEAEKLP